MARQVLPIAGAIVGAFFGQPQIGFAIGSMIGNAVDPQRVKVPGIRELPTQTADEGAYRQVVYGTCWINQTNVIDFSEVRRVTQRERQGKGGGPVVESERLYRTYAIGLGEPLEAIRVIRRDGKIVYDVRPGSTILADSAAFAERFRFYTGAEDQLPDPDLEAIHGVGNTPYYRGTAYLVFPNDDLTDTQGRIPTYEVEGVRGVSAPASSGKKWFAGPVHENGAGGGSTLFYVRADSADGLVSATPEPLPANGSGVLSRISSANGAVFFHRATAASVSFDGGVTWHQCNTPLSTTLDVTWSGAYYYCGLERSADGITWSTVTGLPPGTEYLVAQEYQHELVAVRSPLNSSLARVSVSVNDGELWTERPLFGYIVAYVTPGGREWKMTLNSTAPFYTDDFFSSVKPDGSPVQYSPFHRGDESWVRKAGGNTYSYQNPSVDRAWANTLGVSNYGSVYQQTMAHGDGVTAVLRVVSGSPDQFFVYTSATGTPGSWLENPTPIYGTGLSIVYCAFKLPPTIDAGQTTLSAVLEDVAARCGLASSEVDFSALDAVIVDGVTLGGAYSGADACMLFMPAYFFDLVQPEKVLVAVVRGGASLASVTADDMAEEPDENILRGQDIELPRALMLKYLNPGQNYAAPAAVVSRTSPDVRVTGEVTMELPISLDETAALRVADRMLKVMWEDLNGEITFSLPSGPWAWLTPTDILTLSLRGGVYRIRVEKVEESAGILKVTARRDRQSAYTSNLTAPSLPAPTPPPPAQPGDTKFVVMNLPALIDEDDRLGVYIAMTGAENSAWAGAQVAYRRQGATDWIVLGSFTTRAVMGELLAPLPYASPFYTDTTNPLQVSLEYAADQLETLTYTEFLSERNPAAIVKPDYTAEIVQFRYAQDDSNSDWTLTTLQRGRLNTEPETHLAGATFVMLDGAIFLPLPSSLIGQTLEFRVTSLGTSPETAPTQTLVWNPAYSQYEFAPEFLELERSGGTISGSWSPRHRFGTDVMPIQSANFLGWRVTLTDGSLSETLDVIAPSFSASDGAYSGPITVTVHQRNRITGDGPGVSGVVP